MWPDLLFENHARYTVHNRLEEGKHGYKKLLVIVAWTGVILVEIKRDSRDVNG